MELYKFSENNLSRLRQSEQETILEKTTPLNAFGGRDERKPTRGVQAIAYHAFSRRVSLFFEILNADY
jgi:hypothetical protein